jgi:hypothetical protein
MMEEFSSLGVVVTPRTYVRSVEFWAQQTVSRVDGRVGWTVVDDRYVEHPRVAETRATLRCRPRPKGSPSLRRQTGPSAEPRLGKQPGSEGKHLAQVERPDAVATHAPGLCTDTLVTSGPVALFRPKATVGGIGEGARPPR